tara:strand:+ start:419 stop:547 length:129 start_codon:yes stop_codon:yes gene_type:complete
LNLTNPIAMGIDQSRITSIEWIIVKGEEVPEEIALHHSTSIV